MADNDPANDAVDKALRLFVYGPVGLACYLRDSAPTFMHVFVSRGKREVDGARRTVEEKLGLTKPEPAPAPSVQQRLTDGLGRVASQAGSVVAAVASPVVGVATGAGAPDPSARASDASSAHGSTGTNGSAPRSSTSGSSTSGSSTSGSSTSGSATPASSTTSPASDGGSPDLPISGYDQLSASQVIERLDGLSRGALDRIQVYELAHRARRTILASIDQLTR